MDDIGLGSTAYDDMSDDHLLSPDEIYTELGEVPAEERKGSLSLTCLLLILYDIPMSKKQKLIMEGWRDFLSAATFGHVDHRKRKEVEFSASLADVALYVDEDGDRIQCFLYIPAGFNGGTPVIDNINKPKLVGFVTLDKLSSRYQLCIPNTYQVSFSAVAAEFQRGMGTLLYNIAAQL